MYFNGLLGKRSRLSQMLCTNTDPTFFSFPARLSSVQRSNFALALQPVRWGLEGPRSRSLSAQPKGNKSRRPMRDRKQTTISQQCWEGFIPMQKESGEVYYYYPRQELELLNLINRTEKKREGISNQEKLRGKNIHLIIMD